jgi:competence protein ComEA
MSFIRKMLGCAIAACFALPVLATDTMQPATEAQAPQQQVANAAQPAAEQLATNSAQPTENANMPQDATAANQQPVNINTATADQLATLKGIGEKRAQAIIAFREQNGPFKSVDDLTSVKGISKKFIEKNRDHLTIG